MSFRRLNGFLLCRAGTLPKDTVSHNSKIAELMSDLGQKRRNSVVDGTSALPRIATESADVSALRFRAKSDRNAARAKCVVCRRIKIGRSGCMVTLSCLALFLQTNTAGAYCALWTVFPKVISGLRKPIAIQAAISFNINLPE